MRILIIKPSSLGDIIHALVAAESLRTRMPGVEIDWVARDIFAPVVRACPTVNKVYVFERKGGVSGFLRLVREIRQTHYDVVLDMQGLARSAAIARLARADRRIGRADAREGAGLLLREKATPPPGASHAVEKLLGFLPPLGLKPEPGTPDFPGLELPTSVGKIPARRAVILFPDSRRPEKEWPHFPKLTSLLLTRLPADTPVIWAGQSRLTPDPAWPSDRFLNLCGKTTLPEAIALIRHAALCVCNDSGPMHIAAALGTPVIALFGPTDPRLYGPFPPDRPTHRVLSAPDKDLAKLTPESVAESVLSLPTLRG